MNTHLEAFVSYHIIFKCKLSQKQDAYTTLPASVGLTQACANNNIMIRATVTVHITIMNRAGQPCMHPLLLAIGMQLAVVVCAFRKISRYRLQPFLTYFILNKITMYIYPLRKQLPPLFAIWPPAYMDVLRISCNLTTPAWLN